MSNYCGATYCTDPDCALTVPLKFCPPTALRCTGETGTGYHCPDRATQEDRLCDMCREAG